MNTIAELKKMKSDITQTMREKGREMLLQEFNQFFADNPEVSAVAWAQWTPHFNDGDPCRFSIRDGLCFLLEPAIKETLEEFTGYNEEPFVGPWELSKDPSRQVLGERMKTFESAVVDNELFQFAFGDGVKVIATPGNFKVEERDHD